MNNSFQIIIITMLMIALVVIAQIPHAVNQAVENAIDESLIPCHVQ
jgi:hypothetical protein